MDDDFHVSVDEEAVSAYVKELAGKYNTCYKPKTLKTSYGSNVTINNGPYGRTAMERMITGILTWRST